MAASHDHHSPHSPPRTSRLELSNQTLSPAAGSPDKITAALLTADPAPTSQPRLAIGRRQVASRGRGRRMGGAYSGLNYVVNLE